MTFGIRRAIVNGRGMAAEVQQTPAPTHLPRTRCDTQYRFAAPGPLRAPAFGTDPALRSGIRMPQRVRDKWKATPSA
ncbi:MAG: hypothetical protein JWR89_2803 [Tardiphaga sp.]|nr:hypothetical protein [Tardiphaga sp.]